jgi:hypothetical protein
MLHSLPSVSRLIPALLLTLIITVIVYRSLSRHSAFQSGFCEVNGQCSADEELLRPPTRQELISLEHKIDVLSEDIDKLRKPEPPKPLTPEVWENRRTECGEGVVRNIDYHHVHSLKNKAYCLERQS